MKIKAKW